MTSYMKSFFSTCWVLASNFVFGQFAIIYDKDGFSNIRSSTEKGNNIIDKLENGHLVYFFETNGNWTNVDYTKNKKELNGQVYKDRLKYISDFQVIPILLKEKNKVIHNKDSIKIIIAEQKFEKSKYKLTFNKENKNQLEYINNKRYWGTDGQIPRTEYKSIEIYIGIKRILMPKISLDNLFETSLYNTQVNYDKKNDILYIQSMNSDGAGSYEVIWKMSFFLS